MKTRKELKQSAKEALKKNYIICVIVAFITTLVISGGYEFYTDIYNGSLNQDRVVQISDENVEEIKEEGVRIETTSIKDMDGKTVVQMAFQNILGIKDLSASSTKEYTQGVFAVFANKIKSSNSFIFGCISALNTLIFSENVSHMGVLTMSVIVLFIVFVFIRNLFTVTRARFFLESTRYTKTSVNKIFFLYNVKKSCHVAWIMFIRFFLLALWYLTVIGGIIKKYSYMMIPYILAENPSINRKEAFELSKKMMYGHKWEAFVLELSFIGWHILQIFTFNLTNLFWSDAYFELTIAYYYLELRKIAKENKIEHSELLKDDLLVGDFVNKEYSLKNYILPTRQKRKLIKIDYEKDYSLKTLILFFFTFAIIGWLWEVALHLIDGEGFVNRGTMFGPWLPIYGFGVVFILVILKPFRKKPLINFILSIILCAILEYATAWGLETFAGKKWWDYSGYFMTLHGRICLEGLIVFGLGGCGFTYIIAPLLNSIYSKIHTKALTIICAILISLFCIDAVYSFFHPNTGKGITDQQNTVQTQEVTNSTE